ncbi:FkbM family methyltransferase [Amycolatopsis vastitatis]|uniref:Non-ribosomal peptide synthetase n=1 Tax=Amycolatopsis vastitatis TaxID=1905142 RepID=A0A229SKQ9_9PSEU|nr:FkbM family methyltransferase [Amycolatopsis vastitatis]OXM59349.1 non-ribosomal peptide synthetase [Amycolatopsis vastitatis]
MIDHTEVLVLPDGREVLCPSRDEAASLWAEVREDRSFSWAMSALGEAPVVIDVGAHVGISSLYLADRFPRAHVIACEPALRTFRCLVDNLAKHLPGAVALKRALGAREEMRRLAVHPLMTAHSTLYSDDIDERGNLDCLLRNLEVEPSSRDDIRGLWSIREYEEVSVSTLESVLGGFDLKVVDLVKIDVERGEMSVLDGISDKAWSAIKCLLVDVHDIHGRVEEVARRLSDRGYGIDISQARAFVGSSVYSVFASLP